MNPRPILLVPRGQQREIADRAGVSVSTVSRVLNQMPGISVELQQRVIAAAGELGYTVNEEREPQALRSVTLVSSMDAFQSRAEPFYQGIVSGIEAECRRQQIALSFSAVDVQGLSAFLLDKLSQSSGIGILVLALDDRELVVQLHALGHPLVLVNAEHPDLPIDTFLPDNIHAPEQAVRNLLARGHTRIAHVTFSDRPTIRRRHDAYRAALESAGIAYDPALVIHVDEQATSAYALLRERLAAGPPDFTAIFCASDATAIEAVHALQEAGLRVPADVAVIGFDDLPLAALITPQLTTMRIEREELGALAVQRLIARAVNPHLSPVRVELACRLVERQSA